MATNAASLWFSGLSALVALTSLGLNAFLLSRNRPIISIRLRPGTLDMRSLMSGVAYSLRIYIENRGLYPAHVIYGEFHFHKNALDMLISRSSKAAIPQTKGYRNVFPVHLPPGGYVEADIDMFDYLRRSVDAKCFHASFEYEQTFSDRPKKVNVPGWSKLVKQFKAGQQESISNTSATIPMPPPIAT